MSARTHLIISAATLALVFSLAGCSGAGAKDRAGSPVSPEAALENLKSALKARDYKIAFAQLTPDCQDLVLGLMAVALAVAPLAEPAKAPQVQEIVAKYEIKAPNVFKLALGVFAAGADEPTAARTCQRVNLSEAALKETIAGVGDKPGYFSEFMEWNDRDDTPGDRGKPRTDYDELGTARLVGLQIDGDTASAKIVVRRGDADKTLPVTFQRIASVWRIDIANMFR